MTQQISDQDGVTDRAGNPDPLQFIAHLTEKNRQTREIVRMLALDGTP
jgi:hypothetical protein